MRGIAVASSGEHGARNGRHDVNLGLPAGCLRREPCLESYPRPVPPELEGDFNMCICPRKNHWHWIDNHRGLDTRIMWRVGGSFSIVESLTCSRLVLAKLCEPPESVRRDPHQHQAGNTRPWRIPKKLILAGSMIALSFQSCSMKSSRRTISAGRDAQNGQVVAPRGVRGRYRPERAMAATTKGGIGQRPWRHDLRRTNRCDRARQ